MVDFIGRGEWLGRLHDEAARVVASGGGRMIALRGRRQTGKSTLLTRFVTELGWPSLFTTAVRGAGVERAMRDLVADVRSAPRPLPNSTFVYASAPTDWDAALRALPGAATEPIVVVLDEFPWAAAADPTLEGTLQLRWDRELSGLPILLVLVGSDVAVMERLTDHERPLFGRAAEWPLPPLSLGDVAEALAGRPSLDVMDTALVTGGFPRSVGAVREASTAVEWVEEQLADELSELAAAPRARLAGEFPAPDQTRAVLEAIGADEVGESTFARVADRLPVSTHSASATISRALTVLRDKGVVTIDTPVGASPRTRLRRYRLDDTSLRFWLRFVEPRLADISRGRSDLAVDAFRRGWPAWRGKAVEPLVREAIARGAGGTDEPPATVGAWWTRSGDTEVDVVAADASGHVTALGSIKWRERQPFALRDVAALAVARDVVPGASGARLLAVCPAGATPDAAAQLDQVLDADDILAVW